MFKTLLLLALLLAGPQPAADRMAILSAEQHAQGFTSSAAQTFGPFWTPSEAEAADAYAAVLAYLQNESSPASQRTKAERQRLLNGWSSYRFQFAGMTPQGELHVALAGRKRRIVRVGAICDAIRHPSHRLWQSRWVRMEDGGACYFQAWYDPADRKILMFAVNRIH